MNNYYELQVTVVLKNVPQEKPEVLYKDLITNFNSYIQDKYKENVIGLNVNQMIQLK